jgi:hypothetical protein
VAIAGFPYFVKSLLLTKALLVSDRLELLGAKSRDKRPGLEVMPLEICVTPFAANSAQEPQPARRGGIGPLPSKIVPLLLGPQH